MVRSSPKEPLFTRRELAKRLDGSPNPGTLVKWERDGMPVAERGRKGKPSLYLESAVRAWLLAREEAARKTPPYDVAQERARKERAQAELAEQTYRARSRELLPAAEVERAWTFEVQAVRTAILASYTTQADRVHRAATLDGVAGVESVLKDIAEQLLLELSAEERELPPSTNGEGHAA